MSTQIQLDWYTQYQILSGQMTACRKENDKLQALALTLRSENIKLLERIKQIREVVA